MVPRASLGLRVALLLLVLASLLVSGAARSSPNLPAPAALAPSAAQNPSPLAATLSFALTASTAQAGPKDTVAFTVYLNNTGTQAAPSAWINVSAASGFAFLGDTAAGNLSGYPHYSFANVALGLHSFRMSFRVDVGVAPGSRLAVSGTLVYADGTGSLRFLGPASASVLVGVAMKQLYLGWGSLDPSILSPVPPTGSLSGQGTFTLTVGGPSLNFDLTPPLARPFRLLNASAVLYLQPITTPSSLAINLTLVDLSGSGNAVVSASRTYSITGSGYWTLFYTFPSTDYTFAAGHQIRLQVLNAAASDRDALLATNATATPSHLDLQTTTYVSVDAVQPAVSPTTYLSPKSPLVVTANVSDPFGRSEIVAAHLNVTGPAGTLSGWSDPFSVVAVDPATPSAWALFRRTFSPALANGTYSIEVTAVERNAVTAVADGAAVVRAPAFTLQKVASPNQAKSGSRITYYLWYNNTGTGPAGRVWLNDSLPSQVNFLNSSIAPTSVAGSAYSWVLSSVPVGSHVLQMFVQVRGGISGVSFFRNWASLNDSDPQGFLWPAVRSHADVVLNGPFLSLRQSSVPSASVHSNQSVIYAISVENTGDAAATLWVNDTVPAGLVYLSDTATGGSRTIVGNVVHWTFPGMASGAVTPTYLNFTVSARAAGALGWGTILRNVVGLNDTSTNGILMPDQLSVLALTVSSPSIVGPSASFGVPITVPNVGLPLYVNFTNGGDEPAGTTWINLTLDPDLRLVSAGVPASLTNSVLHLILPGAPLGANRVVAILAASPSVSDGQILSASGSLVALDGYGNVLPAVPVAAGTVRVALPNVSFSLNPVSTTAEAGTTVLFTVTGGNSGTGVASAVWLNLSLPAGLTYVNDSFGTTPTGGGSSLSWALRAFAPGPRTYALRLAVNDTAGDGAMVTLGLSVRSFDAGGNAELPSDLAAHVSITAPSIRLSAWADANRTAPNERLTYTLVAKNLGSTTAQTLWLTDALDGHVSLVYYVASVNAMGTTTLNWTFHDVQPGQVVVITVVVQVADGTPGNALVANLFSAAYTNSAGVPLDSSQAPAVVVPVAPDLLPLFLILLGGTSAGSLVVFVVYRRYRVEVEDVFLVYRDGILVSHLAQGGQLEKDEDQLSGMLTAVQDFVKDAFTYGEHRELHQLEFGDYHVLIERGKLVYLAVVYRGRDSGLIRKKVRTVLDRVESTYGAVFDEWDGDMAQVSGTQTLLREGFVEDKHPWSLVTSR